MNFTEVTRSVPQKLGNLTALVAFVFATMLASGCSTFHRDWKQALAQPVQWRGLEGPWDGTWRSDVNGHHGRLRCLITRGGQGRHEARFHANYKKILSFGYPVKLEVRETNGVFSFEGAADLGWWAGGEYRYRGHATGTNFFSTYHSKHDHGTFQMTRPGE